MLFKALAVSSRPRSQQVVLLCAEHRVGGGVHRKGQLDADKDGLVRRNLRAVCLAQPVGDPSVRGVIAGLDDLGPAFEAVAPAPQEVDAVNLDTRVEVKVGYRPRRGNIGEHQVAVVVIADRSLGDRFGDPSGQVVATKPSAALSTMARMSSVITGSLPDSLGLTSRFTVALARTGRRISATLVLEMPTERGGVGIGVVNAK